MPAEPASPPATDDRPNDQPPRPRTVLLVEDDEAVREFVRAALEQAGHVVVAAADGRDAGDLFAADPDRFDIVLTDVVMPQVGGPELAVRVRQLRTGVPVLFMSAFPGGPGVSADPLTDGERLLPKPFTIAELLGAVNDLLGGRD